MTSVVWKIQRNSEVQGNDVTCCKQMFQLGGKLWSFLSMTCGDTRGNRRVTRSSMKWSNNNEKSKRNSFDDLDKKKGALKEMM